jgi:hypothetical protein
VISIVPSNGPLPNDFVETSKPRKKSGISASVTLIRRMLGSNICSRPFDGIRSE